MKRNNFLERAAFCLCLVGLAVMSLGTKACQTDYYFASETSIPTSAPTAGQTGSSTPTETEEPLIEETATSTATATKTSTRTHTAAQAHRYGAIRASAPTAVPEAALILKDLQALGQAEEAKNKPPQAGGQVVQGSSGKTGNWLGRIKRDAKELDQQEAEDQPGNVWEQIEDDEEEADSEIISAATATAQHGQ
jgi:hypothetical protein